jgi:hypothetical protein
MRIQLSFSEEKQYNKRMETELLCLPRILRGKKVRIFLSKAGAAA